MEAPLASGQFDPAFPGGVPTRGVKIAGESGHLSLVHIPSPSACSLVSAISRHHPARQVSAVFTARQFGGVYWSDETP